jgi:hypothetical protein
MTLDEECSSGLANMKEIKKIKDRMFWAAEQLRIMSEMANDRKLDWVANESKRIRSELIKL